MSDNRIETATFEAGALVGDFIAKHRHVAIPALIGCIVMCAVEFGAADLVKNSLRNAIDLADAAESARKETQQ